MSASRNRMDSCPTPFDRVGEHFGGIGVEARCAIQLSDGVLIVVQYHDVHGALLCRHEHSVQTLSCQAGSVRCSRAARRSSSAQTSAMRPEITRQALRSGWLVCFKRMVAVCEGRDTSAMEAP